MIRTYGWLAALAISIPVCVQAQILDFDPVCSSPPCTLSTQYSANGLTFSATLPTTVQIRAGGIDGLTGPNGARYVRVTNAPTQVSIVLSRLATYFSLQAARATSSSGPVNLAVSYFKVGVQVGSTQNLTLTTPSMFGRR